MSCTLSAWWCCRHIPRSPSGSACSYLFYGNFHLALWCHRASSSTFASMFSIAVMTFIPKRDGIWAERKSSIEFSDTFLQQTRPLRGWIVRSSNSTQPAMIYITLRSLSFIQHVATLLAAWHDVTFEAACLRVITITSHTPIKNK